MVEQNRCVSAEYAEKSLELIDNNVNNVNIASRANDLILSLLIFLFMHLFFHVITSR